MTITKPTKINFKDGQEKNQGFVTIEPCYPGYGITMGNALRRVLLSSLDGSAVVGVKIKGANHEFMALPNVKEDVLNIILNLKQLVLKVHSDEEVKLELDIAGKKEVKASDIKKNAEVEIINSDLVLANITDMAGSLKMEITVSKGKGYRSVDQTEGKKNEIGYIEIDSVFSPVISAGVKVENVRVGKMTNWERLVLDLTTNGTITPKEAFENAVKILIEQFGSLIEEPKEEKKEKKKKEEEKEKTQEDKKTKK